MKRSRILGLVLAIGVAASFPASGAVAASAPLTLTVQGSRSAETRITIPRTSTVTSNSGLASKQVAITGRGRAAGVVLERLGGGPGALLVALNYNACGAKGCKPLEAFEFVDGTRSDPPSETGESKITLPAGTYRVVLVADGAPVTARLKLNGLAESLTVQPQRESGTRFHKITDITDTPAPAGFTYSGGRTYQPTPGGAFVGFQELYRTVPGAAAAAGTCVIYGEPPPADAYAPGCPTGDRTSNRQQLLAVVTAPGLEETTVVSYGATAVPKDQLTSIGSYLVTAVPVLESSVTQIEVPLGRAPRKSSDATGGRAPGDDAAGRRPQADAADGRDDAPDAQSGAAPSRAPALPATGGTVLLPLLGLGMITVASRLRRLV